MQETHRSRQGEAGAPNTNFGFMSNGRSRYNNRHSWHGKTDNFHKRLGIRHGHPHNRSDVPGVADGYITRQKTPTKSYPLHDNTTGQAWLSKPCTTSPRAKRLTSVLCSILLAHPSLSLDPVYINTKDNTLADEISRLQSPPNNLTFSVLVRKHPQVSSYRRFHPSPELLSDIYCALQMLRQPAITRQRPLGRFDLDSNTGSNSVKGTNWKIPS